jgi:hypothetical protein
MTMQTFAATVLALALWTGCATMGGDAARDLGTLALESAASERVSAKLSQIDHKLAVAEQRCRGPGGDVAARHRLPLREVKKRRTYLRQRTAYLQRRWQPEGLLAAWLELDAQAALVEREVDQLTN